MVELSTKPYLIRAIYEWCADCGYTPYLSVRVDENTRVPMEYVKEGEIVLNVGQGASRNLTISNDIIQFSARFNGVSREIAVPTYAVQGIFARETGKGAFFETEETPEQFSIDDKSRSTETDAKPGLRLASVSTLSPNNAEDGNSPTEEGAPQAASNINTIRTMRSVPNFPVRAEAETSSDAKPAADKPKSLVAKSTEKSAKKTPSLHAAPAVAPITPAPTPPPTPALSPVSLLPSSVTPATTMLPVSATPAADQPPEDPPPAAPAGRETGAKKSGLRVIK